MTAHTTEHWVNGERYADTAHLSTEELAQVIASDLADPANPYGLPDHFAYQANADTSGPVPQLLIRVSGITAADGDMAVEAALITVHHAVNEYGCFRFHDMFPRNARFEHTALAVTPDGRLQSTRLPQTTARHILKSTVDKFGAVRLCEGGFS